MIFLTGDIHGEIDIKKISNSNWDIASSLTHKDYLIILGDFGLPFFTTDTTNEPLTNKDFRSARKSYLYWMKWLSQKPYTILWIDGNHDNHLYWANQEETEWHSGKVNIHPLAQNVIHLKRGEIYDIDGYTFWVMGGAKSSDRAYRTLNLSYWEEEIPSFSEMNYGIDKLNSTNMCVDFILTHAMPSDLLAPVLKVKYPDVDPTGSYLNEIYRTVKFQHWFCGHYHVNVRNSVYKMQVLYEDIVNLQNYVGKENN